MQNQQIQHTLRVKLKSLEPWKQLSRVSLNSLGRITNDSPSGSHQMALSELGSSTTSMSFWGNVFVIMRRSVEIGTVPVEEWISQVSRRTIVTNESQQNSQRFVPAIDLFVVSMVPVFMIELCMLQCFKQCLFEMMMESNCDSFTRIMNSLTVLSPAAFCLSIVYCLFKRSKAWRHLSGLRPN